VVERHARNSGSSLESIGGADGDRTRDLLTASQFGTESHCNSPKPDVARSQWLVPDSVPSSYPQFR